MYDGYNARDPVDKEKNTSQKIFSMHENECESLEWDGMEIIINSTQKKLKSPWKVGIGGPGDIRL